MRPKLISFKLCPFVQRAVIVLERKKIEYDIEYIDLANPPAWFSELSPLKRVPLLLVGADVIFESMVINEYLDEAYPNRLHPQDLVLRAKNRSWIEFGSECMWDVFHLSVKESEREFYEVRAGLHNKLDQVESVVAAAPFFNGAEFSLVDAGYAPLLQRLDYLDRLLPGIFDVARHPKVNTWKNNLMNLEAIKKSCVPDIEKLYHENLWKRQGYISRFLDKTKYSGDVVKSVY